MSSRLAVKPIARRCWATSAGPREALLVTNSVRERTAARVFTSGELRDPLFGVGEALGISGRGVDEPLQCVLVAAKRDQRFGVGVEQPGCRLPGAGRIQLRGRQNRQGLLVL